MDYVLLITSNFPDLLFEGSWWYFVVLCLDKYLDIFIVYKIRCKLLI